MLDPVISGLIVTITLQAITLIIELGKHLRKSSCAASHCCEVNIENENETENICNVHIFLNFQHSM
jgi:hypothetical protein